MKEKEKFMSDIIELNNVRLSESKKAQAHYKEIQRLEAELKEERRKFNAAIDAMQKKTPICLRSFWARQPNKNLKPLFGAFFISKACAVK